MREELSYGDEKIIRAISPAEHISEKHGSEYIYSYLDSHIEQFNRKVDEIERRCYDTKENPDELLNIFTRAVKSLCFTCEEFEQAFGNDQAAIADAQSDFRDKTNRHLMQSYFVNRARTWPQGYPGDYKTLEDVYRNSPMSSGIGFYADRYFLATTLAVGVRERLATLTDILKEQLAKRSKPYILNVACGSCRELFEAAPEVKQSGAMITCIDFDADALTFASNRLAFTGIPQETILFRKYNALKMVNQERNRREFGMQDIIYSTGFFDYVEDDVLIRLMRAAYDLLNPNGVLIASFKDCRRYQTQEYHWFVDWHGFLQRTEDDMWALFDKADIPRSLIETRREKSEVIKFFIVTKH
ncbi:MAG TPA: class I SAM-dependent methyltransferase [Nitrospirota bacterium]|nr:class I SAM-dependent methyltransferase [Nitrospirota bacterium]